MPLFYCQGMAADTNIAESDVKHKNKNQPITNFV
jgi:hypothetical protein